MTHRVCVTTEKSGPALDGWTRSAIEQGRRNPLGSEAEPIVDEVTRGQLIANDDPMHRTRFVSQRPSGAWS